MLNRVVIGKKISLHLTLLRSHCWINSVLFYKQILALLLC